MKLLLRKTSFTWSLDFCHWKCLWKQKRKGKNRSYLKSLTTFCVIPKIKWLIQPMVSIGQIYISKLPIGKFSSPLENYWWWNDLVLLQISYNKIKLVQSSKKQKRHREISKIFQILLQRLGRVSMVTVLSNFIHFDL